MSLDNFRSKYPGAYDDMPDNELADRVYDKFYSHLDREDYNQKMGLTPTIVENVADFSTAPESYKPAPFETPDSGVVDTVSQGLTALNTGTTQPSEADPFIVDPQAFEEVEGTDPIGRLKTAGGQVIKGAGQIPSSMLKSAAMTVASDTLGTQEFMREGLKLAPGYKPELEQKETDPREHVFYKTANAFDEFLSENIKTNPKYEQEFWAGKVPHGMGSMLGFMFSAVVGRGALGKSGMAPGKAGAVSVAVPGAAVQAVDQFEDALMSGADLEGAYSSAKWGAALGTSEALPIVAMLNRFDKKLGGSIKRTIIDALKEGTEEAIQESFQTIMSNLIANQMYDPDRKMWIGVEEGAGVGFTTGVLTSVLLSMLGMKQMGTAQKPTEDVEPEGPRETFDPTAPQEPTPDEIQAQAQGEAGRDLKEFIDDSRPTDEVLAEREESRAQEAAQAEAAAQAEELDAALEQAAEQGQIEQELAEVAPEATEMDALGEIDAILDGREVPVVEQPVTEGTGERTDPVKAETPQDVDVAAIQANPNPSEAQIESGTYKKGHLKLHGLDITIENARGDMRRGTDSDGEQWEVQMPAHYGYVKRTEGADGDHVDVYIGESTESKQIFIVDQVDPQTGVFDEHKIVMGTQNVEQAADLYQAGFSDNTGAARMGAISQMTIAQFQNWLKNGKTKKAFNYQEPVTVQARGWDSLPDHVKRIWAVEAGFTKKQAQTMAERSWSQITGKKAKAKLGALLDEKRVHQERLRTEEPVETAEIPAPERVQQDMFAKAPEPEQVRQAPEQTAEKAAEAVTEVKPEDRRAEPHKDTVERREDTGKRKHVDEMTGEEKDAEIEFLRTHDLLTGLHNYEAFKNDKAFGKHVAFFDLDDFKTTNTTLGHALADDILKSVANYLSQKNSDSVRFYRRSGDEFLARFKDEEAAKMHMRMTQDTLGNTPFVMQYLDEETNQTIRIAGKGVGLSYGIGKSEQTAEKQADADKARRKQAGQRRGERDAIERSGEARKSPEPETPVSEVQPEITPAAEPTAVLDLNGNPIPSGLMIEVKYDIVDTGETGTATVPAAETMAELRAKQDTYKQLQDCLR